MKKEIIVHELISSHGSNESSSVKQITDIKTGETELVISKTIIERYPVQDYEKVMQLHDELNRGGGRKLWNLKDLTE